MEFHRTRINERLSLSLSFKTPAYANRLVLQRNNKALESRCRARGVWAPTSSHLQNHDGRGGNNSPSQAPRAPMHGLRATLALAWCGNMSIPGCEQAGKAIDRSQTFEFVPGGPVQLHDAFVFNDVERFDGRGAGFHHKKNSPMI